MIEQILRVLRGALQWWVVVAPWEQALRVRFGKHVDRLGPGVHLRLPLVHAVYRQSVRTRWCDQPVQTITTADGDTVTLSAVLGYKIEDVRRLYETLHHAEATLRNMAMSAVAEAVYSLPSAECTPGAIEAHVCGRLDFTAYGLGEPELRVTDFAFVRTYRLIQDQQWVAPGTGLDTEEPTR